MSDNKEIIERIRNSFLSLAQERSDSFHPWDVEMVKTEDWAIERFLLSKKTEENALKGLVKAMEWRKTYCVNEFTENYFPQDLHKIGLFNTNLFDKEGRPLLWWRLRLYSKALNTCSIKQYMVYLIEKMDRQVTHQGWAFIIDSSRAGLSNVSKDLIYFLDHVLENYYPNGIKYFSVVEMPWIINSTAKLIMSFMNEKVKNYVKFLKKDDLKKYMDERYIPTHLNGLYDEEVTPVHEKVRRGSFKEFTHNIRRMSVEQIEHIIGIFKSK